MNGKGEAGMDKLAIDENALISTDVDRLIRTLSEKQRIGIHELENLCNIDGSILAKWIRVLEEEGYISLEYGLTGTYIIWRGIGEDTVVNDYKLPRDAGEGMTVAQAAHEELGAGTTGAKDTEAPYIETLKQSEALSRELRQETEEDLKANILGKLGEDAQDGDMPSQLAGEETGTASQDDRHKLLEQEISEIPEPNERKAVINDEFAELLDDIGVGKTPKQSEKYVLGGESEKLHGHETYNLDETDRPDEPEGGQADGGIFQMARQEAGNLEQKNKMKELVNAYLGEINKEKLEIERLKKKKDDLYRKKILDLESRIEADIVSATEKILDKEGRILELKERVLELPDKVEEVDRLHRTIERLRKESRASMQAARQKAEECISELKDSEAEIRLGMETHRKNIENESAKIRELDALGAAAATKLEKTRAAVDVTKQQLAELGDTMRVLLSDLEEATEMKVEISDMADRLKHSLADKEGELDGLEQHLEQLKQVEQWTRDYIVDYERKVDEIEKYVLAGNDDLARLREAAEKEYIKKYLTELESMTEIYEAELHGVAETERNIDEEIAASKKRLDGLVQQSREMIKKLRSDAGTVQGFSAPSGEARDRIERMRKIVEEREQGRELLREGYARTRQGRQRIASTKRVKNVGSKPEVRGKKDRPGKGRKK